MKRQGTSLDEYIVLPESMKMYLSYNGRHFSKKAYEYAVSLMRDRNNNKVNIISKEELNNKLKAYAINIDNDVLYDANYVYSMCISDFYGSSIKDEHHVLLYVKDLVDDQDAVDGFIFNRWYSDMNLKGMPIDWEEIL